MLKVIVFGGIVPPHRAHRLPALLYPLGKELLHAGLLQAVRVDLEGSVSFSGFPAEAGKGLIYPGRDEGNLVQHRLIPCKIGVGQALMVRDKAHQPFQGRQQLIASHLHVCQVDIVIKPGDDKIEQHGDRQSKSQAADKEL